MTISSDPTVVVDVHYGRKAWLPRVDTIVNGRSWRFVFDPTLKRGERFHLGMFMDHGMASPQALAMYPPHRRVLVALESPQESQWQLLPRLANQAALTMTHHLGFNATHQRCAFVPYATAWLNIDELPDDFPKTHLCSFMGSVEHQPTVAYDLRRECAMWLKSTGVPCFGKGLQPVPSKRAALDDFAFSVAMENAQQDLYFTEKIIDCFLTLTVPVYWGCPSIGTVFDPAGMITFNTRDELSLIMADLSMERYHHMLPAVRANRELVLRNRWVTFEDLMLRLGTAIDAHIPRKDYEAPVTVNWLKTRWRQLQSRLTR